MVITNSYVRNRDDCVPLFPPLRNVTVSNITCECGNGLVPCTWPEGSKPGHGGDISDVLFEDATFVRSQMAVAIKSLGSFVGTVSNVTYRNFVLHDVEMATMLNVYGQSGASDVAQPAVSSFQGITIENITGTAERAGKMLCDESIACRDIVMRGVDLTLTGGNVSARPYECSHVFGTAEGCEPKPCLAALKSDDGAPVLLSVSSSRFFVQKSEAVTVVGSGFQTGAVCRLTPSAYGARSGTTWTHGPSALLAVNMTVINATHGTCTPPDADGGVLVEGPGTLSVSNDGKNFSVNALRIDYVNLASIALGRRPYVSEPTGQVVFRSDASLQGSTLTVSAKLPAVPGKTWHWPSVPGGADTMLPLDFDNVPERVHNDMKFTVALPGGGSFSIWRRFMRVPPPPAGSSIEPVQLDATRGGILIDGKPWLGRGYYMSGLNNNASIPSKQRWSVPKGIAAEIERLTEAIKPGDPPVINMGEIYGLGSFAPADQLAVLDAAAENGYKVQYDMTNPGIAIDGGGPFDNDTALHWLRSNVTLVRKHKALLGYYICTLTHPPRSSPCCS